MLAVGSAGPPTWDRGQSHRAISEASSDPGELLAVGSAGPLTLDRGQSHRATSEAPAHLGGVLPVGLARPTIPKRVVYLVWLITTGSIIIIIRIMFINVTMAIIALQACEGTIPNRAVSRRLRLARRHLHATSAQLLH